MLLFYLEGDTVAKKKEQVEEVVKSSKKSKDKTSNKKVNDVGTTYTKKENGNIKKDSKQVKSKNKVNSKKGKKNLKKNKKYIDGKFSLDILDILIIVVITAIVACVSTGLILNYEFKKGTNLLSTDVVSDEKVKDFLETYSEILDNYYEEIDEDAMLEAALSGMLNFLKDNYSIYLDKEETDSLSEMLDGTYKGIGILAAGNVVSVVYEGSPAEEVGMKPNDEIIKINGVDINMENYLEISNYIVNDGSNEIIVLRDGKQLTFVLKTGLVSVPSTSTDVIKSKDKKKNIGRITLNNFSSTSFDEFNEELKKLEKDDDISSLIIDLRGNTGGYLNIASDIANLFLEEGKAIYSLENKNETKLYKDTSKEKREYKVVVLVNGSTASAAEILAAALHDSYGATLVGRTTYGKGKVQTMKHYEDTMIKYTSAKWLRPTGECIDGVGIKPDIEVDVITEGNIIYDKQLDKAIELLS